MELFSGTLSDTVQIFKHLTLRQQPGINYVTRGRASVFPLLESHGEGNVFPVLDSNRLRGASAALVQPIVGSLEIICVEFKNGRASDIGSCNEPEYTRPDKAALGKVIVLDLAIPLTRVEPGPLSRDLSGERENQS